MGPSGPTQTSSTVTQTNLPEYLKGPVLDVIGRAQTVTDQPYTPYPYQRTAGYTPAEQQVQQNVLGMQGPNQFAVGSGLAAAAGQASLNQAQYTPGQFAAQQVGAPNLTQYSMAGPERVSAQQVGAPQMGAAQTGFAPGLEYFRMEGPQAFGVEQAGQYMSPYMQQVVDVQKREAIRNAQQGQLVQDLGAARQGTYGGSRQLIAGLERERQLGQQLGDIQAAGSQAAFQQAQQQFNTEQALRQAAGQQNLQAALGVQQLGTETGLRTALANLDAESQSRVQNLAAQLQTQGLNSEQALRAALANQQVGLTTGQQNLQAALQTQQLGTETGLRALLANQQTALEAQRLGEQSRQFGSQQGLAALSQAGQLGQTLGNLGTYQQQADLARLQAQQQAAAMPRTMEQQQLDTMYQDFLRQRDYPMEQLSFLSSIIRGLPYTPSSTQTTYGQGTNPLSYLSSGLGSLAARSIVG
jgi:hypothetical protein